MFARFFILTAIACCAGSVSAADLPHYDLEEYLGRSWESHLVNYSLSEAEVGMLQSGCVLVDSQNNKMLHQIDASTRTLSFLATLKPFEKIRYRFDRGSNAPETDLHVEDTGTQLEIGNARFALRIRKRLAEGQGPLESWRLASGHWVGGSALILASKVEQYQVRILQRGPVFIRVSCDMRFENGGTYRQVYELQSGEPLVTLRETFDAPGDTGSCRLSFRENFEAQHILYRTSRMDWGLGVVCVDAIPRTASSTPFLLEPWLHWNFGKNRGTGFSLVDDASDDLLFLMTSMPTQWVNPTIPVGDRAPSLVKLQQREETLFLDLDIKHGQRELLLGALKKSEVLSQIIKDGGGRLAADAMESLDEPDLLTTIKDSRFKAAMLSQQYQMKHSDFPLDRIKDYILEWPEIERTHPRLILNQKQLAEYRALSSPDDHQIAKLAKQEMRMSVITKRVMPMYLASGDDRLAEVLTLYARPLFQDTVTKLTSGEVISVGTAPHNYIARISGGVNVLDAIYSELSAEARKRIRARLAFLGYLVNSPAYWDASRGFGAMFINMHTTVHKTQAVIAAMLSDHPMAEAWMDNGMAFLENRLLNKWVDAEGRWIGTHVEAPHYAMGSLDDLLATLVIAKNAGMSDLLDSPAMKQMGEYFAKISTPPDSRVKNWRHMPPIGNTYKFEPTGIFAILASVYKESDPEYAARMQWMQNQNGDPLAPVVGGYLAGFAGYRTVFQALTVAPAVPDYRSEWLNESGVILRSRYATPEENLLYLIAGNGATPHRHYDRDQGAITLWGRGEIISDDFGYNGCAPEEEQSMLSTRERGAKAARGIMNIARFTTGANLDYVMGSKTNWTRQAVLVKNAADTAGPDYFVIHDSLNIPAAATWRMWLTGKPETVHGAEMLTTGRMEGAEEDPFNLDADDDSVGFGGSRSDATLLLGPSGATLSGVRKNKTDIFFAHLPADSKIETAIKTKTPYGVNASGRYGRTATSQIGLIIKAKAFDSLLTLVFPRDAASEAPAVTAIADGRGFKIEHKSGTDYVFVSESPKAWAADGMQFSGTVGLVQQRASGIVLSLAAKGSLTVNGFGIQSAGEGVSKAVK